MSPKVFISHSAKTDPAQNVKRQLIGALKAAGFGVWEQEELKLNPGEHWLSGLHEWVAGCSAAVVLLSKAALVSPFVQAEVSWLLFRKALDENLPIIPLAVEDIEEEDVPDYLKRTTNLAYRQWWTMSSIDDTTTRVLAEIRKVTLRDWNDPLIFAAQEAVSLIADATDAELLRAGDRIKCDLQGWMPQQLSRHTRFVEALLSGISLPEVARTLNILTNVEARNRRKVLRMIATARVRHDVVKEIPGIAIGPQADRVFGLAIRQPSVAEWHIYRPFSGSRGISFDFYSLLASKQEDSNFDVLKDLRSQVRKECVGTEGEHFVSEDDVDAELALIGSVSPAIAMFKSQSDWPTLLAALRDTCQDLTLGIFAVDEGFHHTTIAAGCEDNEDNLHREFISALRILNHGATG
ncbi:toll/interleukin-1 receptor domain-containing protein [Azospirillum sp. B21]|uniref:toll/interleukin-1 receptor domain-containing protein n=1 Tax=Azospirillum sp. B21 TaxID=2607496 RepID=UPI0011ED4884|nr:toll/interleukin-1 receptor domain-containing protein [Azospirillum sp. B21]KAA0579142.1 toll/interleukin-1 receptor domain-containing protein [Azospirillum sp. B21]